MPPGPRSRLVGAAIALVRERGVEGTGLAELLERSSSARRSIYQNFPGGKLELIEASTRAAGSWMGQVIRDVGPTMDGPGLLRFLVAQVGLNLVDTDFRLGCPIAAAASVSADAAGVRGAAAEVFSAWIDEIAALLERAGHPAPVARSLAGLVVSAVEGAILRARAERSTVALDEVADHLAPLLAAANADQGRVR